MANSSLAVGVCVLYLRMSSAKQDRSIADQRDALTAYAKKQGYRVIREYVDSAISGDNTEKRAGFLKLREDAETRRDFAIILVWDQDRLSRNDPLEVGYWLKPIRDVGIVVETPQGRVDWDTLGGRLIYLISQEMKHNYLRDLSRNTTRGFLASAKRSTRRGTGGKDPSGYVRLNGQVVIDEAKAATIRRIFAEYDQAGASLRSVANSLNRDGILSPRGKKWCRITVFNVLRNQKYAGAFIRFKRQVGKYYAIENGEVVPRSKNDSEGHAEPLVIDGNHEPIIDRELFDRVQRKLAQRRTQTAPKTKRQYLFTGLLTCGDCGRTMASVYRRHNSYWCRSFHQGGRDACYSNSIREDILLDCVQRLIQDRYLSSDALDRLRDRMHKILDQRKPQALDQADRKRLQKKIEVLDGQIDQGASRVFSAPESIVTKLYEKLDRLRADRDQVKQRLEAQERHEKRADQDFGQIIESAIKSLQDLRTAFKKAARSELRELLLSIVSKIELHYSHTPNGKRTLNEFQHGTIFIRPDPQFTQLLNTSTWSCVLVRT